jgi:hypothetical protein
MAHSCTAVAEYFARALVEGRFEAAHSLLTPGQKIKTSAHDLKQTLEAMTAYADGPTTHIEVVNTIDDWPAKEKNDVGWVYVAMAGDAHSEAITVIVAEDNGELLIRSVEWGRP